TRSSDRRSLVLLTGGGSIDDGLCSHERVDCREFCLAFGTSHSRSTRCPWPRSERFGILQGAWNLAFVKYQHASEKRHCSEHDGRVGLRLAGCRASEVNSSFAAQPSWAIGNVPIDHISVENRNEPSDCEGQLGPDCIPKGIHSPEICKD